MRQSIVYAGFLGGPALDYARGIAVDAAGNTYVTGYTSSTQGTFPVTTGPDLTHNGDVEAFVAKVSALSSTAGPILAFRNGFNAIETNTFPSPDLHNSGGNFRLNPALARSSSGLTYLTGRDSEAGIWTNMVGPDESYFGW